MKKIVIKTNRSKPNLSLIVMLKELFPDCEIDIACRDAKTLESPTVNISTKPSMGYATKVEI